MCCFFQERGKKFATPCSMRRCVRLGTDGCKAELDRAVRGTPTIQRLKAYDLFIVYARIV